MITRTELEKRTKTPAKRHDYFCYATIVFDQHTLVYWLLVQQFKTDRKSTQAQLIKDWFLDGNIPENLQDLGFLSRLNIENTFRTEVSKVARINLSATSFTSGGGLIDALQMKISGATKPPADLFDATIPAVCGILDDPSSVRNNGAYISDGGYQLRGTFAPLIHGLKQHLTLAGFNVKTAGIWI